MAHNPTVTRRQLSSGAAWAVPAVLLGATVPAVAASTQDVSIVVTSCTTSGSGSNRRSVVTFTVCATGAAIGRNSTLTLTESDPSGSATPSGTLYANYLNLSGVGPYTLTFRSAFPAGSCGTVVLTYTSVPANLTVTLQVGTILTNLNGTSSNDSASKTFTATGVC